MESHFLILSTNTYDGLCVLQKEEGKNVEHKIKLFYRSKTVSAADILNYSFSTYFCLSSMNYACGRN